LHPCAHCRIEPESIARVRCSIALALIACIWVPLGIPLALRRRARQHR
jgi:hypothetical protein